MLGLKSVEIVIVLLMVCLELLVRLVMLIELIGWFISVFMCG